MSTSSEYDFAGHDDRIRMHYDHAREKHPYFCDKIAPEVNLLDSAAFLRERRREIEDGIRKRNVTATVLLSCEAQEALYALDIGDKAHAVEELYDAIAVLLRTVDVIEGRQKLGKPKEAE